MTQKEKITIKRQWAVADNSMRVTVANATYRQALAYLCGLRRQYGPCDFSQKPRVITSYF